MTADAENLRLEDDASRRKNWKRWGTYLSERQWSVVREDYSGDGDAWGYLPHDIARSRAYRWGEDGLLGLTDRECRLCFAVALWNGKDPFLKERLFGLANPEGNHGEDCKELYYYLDATPTHSYCKALYKYPQAAYPYDHLRRESKKRGFDDPEYELLDTGLFDESRYFDVFVEYAKGSPDDVLIKITIHNRGPDAAPIAVLPTLWFRNTWAWGGKQGEAAWPKPKLTKVGPESVAAEHCTLGKMRFTLPPGGEVVFTENETNMEKTFFARNRQPFVKDAFHRYVVDGQDSAVAFDGPRTKAAGIYKFTIPAGDKVEIRCRLTAEAEVGADPLGPDFDGVFATRLAEADEFYNAKLALNASTNELVVARQAYAGLLWTKQFYYYVVDAWVKGDPGQPPPPKGRGDIRNGEWGHVFSRDILSMPDKWEYPWFAAWDLAFHMVPMARVDPHFAKEQLLLLLREWYMHPNGQIPAFEYALGDVNPPVHAWACWRVYKMTGARGNRDRMFLARAFHKLLLNFTWWVNRKDVSGKNLFGGGFLGLDNVSIFDRSRPLPDGGHLEQADGTAWMAFYCLTMLAIALELASEDPSYEDVASKFLEHFVAIADAMNRLGGTGLWDEHDGFYYDRLHFGTHTIPARLRSVVGLIPLCAVEVLDNAVIDRLPGFKKRLNWFLENRQDLAQCIAYLEPEHKGGGGHRLLAIPSRERLERVLRYMLDEDEFLGPYGIRSLSRYYHDKPFDASFGSEEYRVAYDPADSTSGLFGGNSNWRGPVWFPVNYLLVEALERYSLFYGDEMKVECPVGSGTMMTLSEAARQIALRLTRIFLPDADGRRPCHGDDPRYAEDPHWRDCVLFYEYFHGDNGKGIGASHQTGWTALVARLLDDQGLACGADGELCSVELAKPKAKVR